MSDATKPETTELATDGQQRYVMQFHPTAEPMPMAIFDKDNPGRVVAILTGHASATMEEARKMVGALNAGG